MMLPALIGLILLPFVIWLRWIGDKLFDWELVWEYLPSASRPAIRDVTMTIIGVLWWISVIFLSGYYLTVTGHTESLHNADCDIMTVC